jgi:hypothetical protein
MPVTVDTKFKPSGEKKIFILVSFAHLLSPLLSACRFNIETLTKLEDKGSKNSEGKKITKR